jgi:uncharacterized protein
MVKEQPHSSREIASVKEIYAALNRNDLASYLSFFDPNVDRFESFGSRHQGLEGLKANFVQGREAWAEGSCGPEEFTVRGNRVVVFVHVKVRLKGKVEWINGQVTDVFTFQGAKVVEFYSFADRAEALRWAGIAEG